MFGWVFEKPLLVKHLLAVDLLEIEFLKKKNYCYLVGRLFKKKCLFGELPLHELLPSRGLNFTGIYSI